MTHILHLESFGKHIDIDKLVAVDDVQIDRHQGDTFVYFDMHFQQMDNPVRITKELVYGKDFEDGIKEDGNRDMFDGLLYGVNGEKKLLHQYENKHDIKAVHEMQLEVDRIIRIWGYGP